MNVLIGFILDNGTAIHATISSIVPVIGQQVWFNPETMAKAKLHPDTKLWVKSHQYQYTENESGIEVTLSVTPVVL